MPAIVSSTQLTAAIAAATAASPGTKDAAYIDSLIGAIGSGYRRVLRRNGTTVWSGTASGSLTRTGNTMNVAAVTTTASADADINSGSWTHRIENASNAAIFIESSVGNASSGLPGVLSGSLVSGATATAAAGVLNGPAFDSGTADVDQIIDDMKANTIILNNPPDQPWMRGGAVQQGGDLRSVAVPSWWGGNNFAGTQTYWTHLLPWYVVHDRVGHQSGKNVRAKFWDLELYVLEDSNPTTWRLIDSSAGPPGNSYSRGVAQTGGDASGRYESDGSFSAKLDANGSIYHGYGNGTTNFDPAQVIGLHVRMYSQLILENPLGPDERSQVAYAINVGLDPRPFAGVTWAQLGQGYLPGCGSSRWKAVTNNVTVHTFTTLQSAFVLDSSVSRNSRQAMTDAALRAVPPPAF